MSVVEKPKQKANKEAKLVLRGERALIKNEVQCYVFNTQGLLFYKSDKGLMPIGGEIKSGESPQQAAARLIYEKAGIVVNALQLDGEVLFMPKDANNVQRRVFVLSSTDFSGSGNANAEWVRKEEANKHISKCEALILPLVLSRKKFRARFVIGPSCDELISYQLDEL